MRIQLIESFLFTSFAFSFSYFRQRLLFGCCLWSLACLILFWYSFFGFTVFLLTFTWVFIVFIFWLILIIFFWIFLKLLLVFSIFFILRLIWLRLNLLFFLFRVYGLLFFFIVKIFRRFKLLLVFIFLVTVQFVPHFFDNINKLACFFGRVFHFDSIKDLSSKDKKWWYWLFQLLRDSRCFSHR